MAKVTNQTKAPRKIVVLGENGAETTTLVGPGETFEGKVVETDLFKRKVEAGAFKVSGDLSKASEPAKPAAPAPKAPPTGGAATGQN